MKKSILLYAVLLLATMLILLTSCGTHDIVPPAEADTRTPADTTTQSTADSTTPSLPDYTLTPSLQSVDQIQSFGLISADGTIVEACSRVSGGYGVSFIQEDGTPVFHPVEGNVFLEKEPLENLAEQGKLGGYRFDGFWRPMDTMRDKNTLEDLWTSKEAPWKIWD